MEIYKGNKYYPTYDEPNSDVSVVAFGIVRLSDGYWYDFGDGTFKASGWTTQYQVMTESENGLWIYTAGWTTPNAKANYKIQFKVTDSGGDFYAAGEELNVTDIVPLVHTTVATPTTKQEMLDAVNAAINARLTGGAVASYSIGGRNLQYISLRELTDLRDKLQREVSDEQGTRNYASFVRPK